MTFKFRLLAGQESKALNGVRSVSTSNVQVCYVRTDLDGIVVVMKERCYVYANKDRPTELTVMLDKASQPNLKLLAVVDS